MNKEHIDSGSDKPSPLGTTPKDVLWGAFFGLISAVGYTAANVFLRALVDCDPVWVSCVKSVPTILLIGPWLIVLAVRHVRIVPPRNTLLAIIFGALIGQLAGNVMFQWSLGVIGIALTVPIALGSIIIGGAILGRIFLHETITARTLISITLLIASVFVLSLGAADAHSTVQSTSTAKQTFAIFAGVVAASIAGVAYATLGVVIRYGVTGRSAVSTTMVLVALIGVISLGGLSYCRLGWTGLISTTSQDFGIMILAGICNAIAFLSLTRALQLTTVTYINSLNASQAAMSAVAGVMIFGEALSIAMIVGVAMTSLGLAILKNRDQTDRHSDSQA